MSHWYFADPSAGSTIIIGSIDGRIAGMATMKHHRFQGPGGATLVGMPQKVLTDEAMRGKGIFHKLYHASEDQARIQGVDLFLTVTNAASTPIFLGKFGYQRMPAPRMVALSPMPGGVEVLPMETGTIPGPDRSDHDRLTMRKDPSHYQWRYLAHPSAGYLALRIAIAGSEAGWIFLRRTKKLGMPVMLLLDLVPSAGDPALLLRAARRIAWKQRCVSLLCLEEERLRNAVSRNGPVLRRSSGLNLLVKGRDDQHTQSLVARPVQLAFGDLDFL